MCDDLNTSCIFLLYAGINPYFDENNSLRRRTQFADQQKKVMFDAVRQRIKGREFVEGREELRLRQKAGHDRLSCRERLAGHQKRDEKRVR